MVKAASTLGFVLKVCESKPYLGGPAGRAGVTLERPDPMRSAPEAAKTALPPADDSAVMAGHRSIVDRIVGWLDDAKAEEIVTIDIRGKSSFGDTMIIATGNTDRHVGAIGNQVQRNLKEIGRHARIEGERQCDWVLIDAGDIVIHVFRPEVRAFYNLEKMWTSDWPSDTQH